MDAMVLVKPGRPLERKHVPDPFPGPGQIRIRVKACGVCRTDLHLVDGELKDHALPVIPGHQIVGLVEETGEGVERFAIGDRVGVPWLASTCGACRFCARGLENLCPGARFTGCHRDGGFAELAVADAAFCLPIPPGFSDPDAAPLLCAGLIGYRAFRMTGDARRIGFYGFGASAHILIQVARHLGHEVFAFTRPGDRAGQAFARKLGAAWAGASDENPPEVLDAALIFAPAGSLVPEALKAVDRGGIVVCAGIHMSDIPSFPYEILWGERELKSVANLTRQDGEAFMDLAPRVPVRTEVSVFSLPEANRALQELRGGRLRGAAVLCPASAT